MGHIIDVKLKQGLYPSRLKLFNQNNSSRLLINELYNASRIYDSVYKVRTELSKAFNKPRVETKIRQQSPEIGQVSMQDLLNVTKIATTFDSKDFIQNIGQKKDVHSINVFAQPSPMLSPRERHILQKN